LSAAVLIAVGELGEPWQEKGLRVLATRESGRHVAEEILRRAEEPGAIILDFAEVGVVTLPFVQEMMSGVHETILRAPETGRIVVAVNLDRDVADAVSHVLRGRKQALAWYAGQTINLLAADLSLTETLRQAQELDSFTAPLLAERLGIEPTAATHRLKRLLQCGAVIRERDANASRGVRHLYHVISFEHVVTVP
jgi:hypothetical protein